MLDGSRRYTEEAPEGGIGCPEVAVTGDAATSTAGMPSWPSGAVTSSIA